jgi:hypothetical protein
MLARVRTRRGRDHERGAVAVEAALVTPLLLLMIFGIIEFSFLLRDHVALTSAVRSGARIASTGAAAGPGTCTGLTDAPTCTPASSPALAQMAADAIQKAGSAMPKDAIRYILVYKANTKGYPGVEGNTTIPASCAGVSNCVRYTWRDSQDKFRYAEGSWSSSSISACFPGTLEKPLESVGVAMVADHQGVTGLFGDRTLSDRASLNFEPLPTATCGTGQHS